MSNELSNYCGGNGQPRLDDPGSFVAPGIGIDDHLACFTPKRSLVRTQYRPPVTPLVSNGPLLRERTGIAEDSAWAGSCWAWLAENLNVRRGGRRCLCGACEPVSQHGAEGRHENRGLLP